MLMMTMMVKMMMTMIRMMATVVDWLEVAGG